MGWLMQLSPGSVKIKGDTGSQASSHKNPEGLWVTTDQCLPPSHHPPPGMQVALEILFRYKHFYRRHPGGKGVEQASWGEARGWGHRETLPGYQVALVPEEVLARAKSAFPMAQRES